MITEKQDYRKQLNFQLSSEQSQ